MVDLQPTLFAGDSSEVVARIYAAVSRAGLPDDARLEGELVGPYCRYSQTLPARIHFAEREPGTSLLAEAVVPDPCFWTCELPFLYSAKLRVVTKDATVGNERAEFVGRFGIRRIGVHGASLYFDAKRFVFRGVRLDSADLEDLSTAKETASALLVTEPTDDFLDEASDEGVLLAVKFHASAPTDELARLGRWPCVAIAVIDGETATGKELRLAARNTLLAQNLAGIHSLSAPALWAHLLWWQIDAGKVPARTPAQDLPIIVYRPAFENATIEESRRACDRLQAELAPLGDFAGYVV
jgi:hypothetical protein